MIEHVLEWPPQPSTLVGFGLMLGSLIALAIAPESAPIVIPAVAGFFSVVAPDNTSKSYVS